MRRATAVAAALLVATGGPMVRPSQAASTSVVLVPRPAGFSAPSHVVVSAGGSVVVFVASTATQTRQIFRYDVKRRSVALVSRAIQGGPGNGSSDFPSVTADGRFVAFTSLATDLVRGDTNAAQDAFVHDLRTGTTRLASRRDDGMQIPRNATAEPDRLLPTAISPDGKWLAFHSCGLAVPSSAPAVGSCPLYARRLPAGRLVIASRGVDGRAADGGARDTVLGNTFAGVSEGQPRFSGDGRFLAFSTYAALIPDDTHRGNDVYVLDLQQDRLRWATEGLDPTQGLSFREPTLDRSGRMLSVLGYPAVTLDPLPQRNDVTYADAATAQVIDLLTGTATSISARAGEPPPARLALVAGRPLAHVVLKGDAAGTAWQLCTRPLPTGTPVPVLSAARGAHAYSSLPTSLGSSADGRVTALTSPESFATTDQDNREADTGYPFWALDVYVVLTS